jgi:hypothetical protein
MPMLGLVIVHHETGVHDARHPAEEREEQAQDKTKQATRHQHRNRRKDDTEKVAERFQEGKISESGYGFIRWVSLFFKPSCECSSFNSPAGGWRFSFGT